MTTDQRIISSLESLIVGFCRSTLPFTSDLRVKGLVAVTADNSVTTYVDVDKTIYRDDHRKLEAGPRNALQLWKKSQNSQQMSGQNQWLEQQQQLRMSGEMKSVRSPLQSQSQHFRMPQMPARARMPPPRMQSPRMPSVRMQQPYVRQSVVRLNKIPGNLDSSSQSTALTGISAAKLLLAQEMLPVARHSEGKAQRATKDCFLPSKSEIENSCLAHSLEAAHSAKSDNQASLSTIGNKNKRKNGNQHDLLVSSDMDSVESKEPWKKIPNLLSGQKSKKAIKESSEEGEKEEEMKEIDEIKNGESSRPNIGNGNSKVSLKKISKMPRGQKTKKALVEHLEEDEDKKVEKEEEEEGEEKKNNKPNKRSMLNEMKSLQMTTQDMDTLIDEHLTTRPAPRKRAKKVEPMDEAKMPRLEKEVDDPSLWKTFISKGTGKKKSVAKQVKS